MVRINLVTENEFASASVNEDGDLTFTRENGETFNAGQVRVDVTPEVQAARDEAVDAAARAEAVGDTNDTIMTGVLRDPESDFGGELSATFVDQAAMLKPGMNLDIWPGMNPIPSTYTAWITGIDADLSGATVTKTVIGQDSYDSDIHLYDAGSGKHTVLMVSGQHPWEVLGQVACRQFFIQFATSSHPAMALLRKQIRLLWIPTVVAGDFRGGRENGNEVNLNRNYPWNWDRATGSDPKGSAPLDQPETQVIKSVLDDYPVSLLFDCHNFGSVSSMDFAFQTAPNAVQGKVLAMEKAHQAWVSANPDAVEATQYADTDDLRPTLIGWGQKYLRYDLQRFNAMTVIFECIATMGGSDSNGNVMSRSGARWYASFIYQTILTWLESGQTDEPVPPFIWLATHNLSSGGYDTPVETGGRLVNSAQWKALQFSFTSQGSARNYVSVPIRHPGLYEITASIHFEGSGATGDTATQVEAGVSFTPQSLSNVGPASNSVRTVLLTAPGGRNTLNLQWIAEFTSIPDEAVYEAQLWFRLRDEARIARILGTSGVQLYIKPHWTGEPNYQPLA